MEEEVAVVVGALAGGEGDEGDGDGFEGGAGFEKGDWAESAEEEVGVGGREEVRLRRRDRDAKAGGVRREDGGGWRSGTGLAAWLAAREGLERWRRKVKEEDDEAVEEIVEFGGESHVNETGGEDRRPVATVVFRGVAGGECGEEEVTEVGGWGDWRTTARRVVSRG